MSSGLHALQIHIQQDKKTATITSVRAPFYRRVYGTLMENLQKNGVLRGIPIIMRTSALPHDCEL